MITFEQAKDQVAVKHGYKKWWLVDFNKVNEEALRDQAAEIYAKSKWDEACEAQKKELLRCYARTLRERINNERPKTRI